jgi:hypothetical protein
MQNLTKNGIKDDTPLFEKSHHGILVCLLFSRKLDRSPRKKLIALFVDRSRPIKQANPKVLDYISQTMVYYPIEKVNPDGYYGTLSVS